MTDADRARDLLPADAEPWLAPAAAEPEAETVSARDLAATLGLSERTIRRAIKRGELAAVRRGRSYAITPAAAARYRQAIGRRPAAPVSGPGARPTLQLVPATEPTEPTPATPLRPVRLVPRPLPVTLPVPLTPFVGRRRELALVERLLRRGGVRLITLTGLGGVGKSRLAVEAARRAAPAYADGSAFVGLAAVRDRALVVPALAAALGLDEGGGAEVAARLHSLLKDRTLLLVADNLEQIPDVGSALADLLGACPRLTILATSRVPLHVAGEHLLAVPPMSLPEPAGDEGGDATGERLLAALAGSDAGRFFADRALAADPAFVLDAANGAAITAICRHLDGLPLALELAASRAAALSPEELLARLDRRLPLLGGGGRDQPDRLRTMRGAIAWSWELLPSGSQRLLRALAVCVGGFTLELAEAMAAPATDGAADVEVAAEVVTLVESGLVQRGGPPGAARFGMLEVVREFALEQLAAAGGDRAARAAHARACLAFVEGRRAALWAAPDEALLNAIEQEHDNLRAALGWLTAEEPAGALRLAAGLGAFWSRRAHWTEGRAWLERALATGADPGGGARAAALGQLGTLAGDQGDGAAAERAFEESLAIAEAVGDERLAARAWRGLGILASNAGDFPLAGERFERALAAFRALDERPGIARSLNDLGLVADRQGEHDRAIALQEAALRLARGLGDRFLTCVILGNLGGAYYDRGEHALGGARSEEALELARGLGDTFGVAVNGYNLGNIALLAGDAPAAAERYLETLQLTTELDEPHLASRAVDRVGAVLWLLGQPKGAARLFGAAEGMRAAIGALLFAEEDADLARRRAAVRAALGEAAYDAQWAVGRAIPGEVAVAEALAHAARASRPAVQAGPGLTAREADVLRLLAEGKSDQEIADALFLARASVSKHVAAILGKFDVASRTAAVAQAFRLGLV